MDQRDHGAALDQHVVELDGDLSTLVQIRGLGQLLVECVVRRVAPAGHVVAQEVVPRTGDRFTQPVGHVDLGVHAGGAVGVHLDVGVELAVGVRAVGIAAEEDRSVDVAQLGLHADLRPPLLDQGLGLLAHRVGGGLVENLQRDAVLLADAVAVRVHDAGVVQELVGAIDILGQAPVVVGRSVGRRRGQHVAGRATGKAVELLGDGVAVNGHGEGLDHVQVRQERMVVGVAVALELLRAVVGIPNHVHADRAHVTQGRVRVGLVDHEALHIGGVGGHHCAQASRFHGLEDLGLHLQVPGVVRLACLQHGPGRSSRVAAALEDDLAEVGLVGLPVVLVDVVDHHIVDPELTDLVGARADGVQVLLGAGLGRRAHAVLELGLLDDGLGVAHEGQVRVGGRAAEVDAHSGVIQGLDAVDVGELIRLGAAGLRGGAVLVGEDYVFSRHRGAIGPEEALLELPGDGSQILGDAAILHGGDLSRQAQDHLAVLVEGGQRLQHQRAGVDVLGAAGEVRTRQRSSLPVEDGQGAAGAPSGGRCGFLSLGGLFRGGRFFLSRRGLLSRRSFLSGGCGLLGRTRSQHKCQDHQQWDQAQG